MQLLCHLNQVLRCRAAGFVHALGVRVALLLGAWCCLGSGVQAQSPMPTDKLLAEVGQWVQQTQQLSAEQFSFAPLDSRVQLQNCDRALVMDAPFASRETVRVRCLGNPTWQLYLRVLLKPGVAPGLVPAAVPQSAAAGTSAPAGAMRRVVVANQVLRAGSIVSASQVHEVDMPAQGLDYQVLGAVKDAENAEMVREVQPGVPLRSYDVRRAVMVKQGQTVLLTVGQGSGFSITARVEALQDGKIGDQIRLKNPESGRFMSGVVTGPNAARGL